MQFDKKITERLTDLISMGDRVLETKDERLASQWATSSQNLLSTVFGRDSDYYRKFTTEVEEYNLADAPKAQGILLAVADDIASGALFNIQTLIEAEVFDDFLEQAKSLLEAGYYQAAAVVCGAVLEDSLRKLCEKKRIALPDKPKLDFMNSELAKKGVYNKLIQKKITFLADLRNNAAHGKWDQFKLEDVEEMIPYVRRLLEEYAN